MRDNNYAAWPVFDIGPKSKALVKRAALDYMEYAPNSHLGDRSRREDLASAFRTMRSWVAAGHDLRVAALTVQDAADSYYAM